jgi:ATP-dependent DNA helicase RecG
MKSKTSNSSKLSIHSSLSNLFKSNKATKTAQSLMEAGINTIEDLLWVAPLHVNKMPSTQSFSSIVDGEFFRGEGRIININARPNFRAKGKGGARLFNINVVVKDLHSENVITLKWFNTYGSVKTKLEKLNNIQFLGNVQFFGATYQVINPEIIPLEEVESSGDLNQLKIQYPTINGVSSHHIKSIVDKIPKDVFYTVKETLPDWIRDKNDLMGLSETFLYLHAHVSIQDEWSKEIYDHAVNRLIYEEFFNEQAKIALRRQFVKKPKAPTFPVSSQELANIKSIFPYDLTKDQSETLDDIVKDLNLGSPMMRMIQGDVGCGKTSIATASALIILKHHFQVAFMCPTEVLATQHFQTLSKETANLPNVKLGLLTGGLPAKARREILEKLKSGEINFIIGTHALFQDDVEFKQLGLAIIDEQHKFGVLQRLKIVNKTPGAHCLIMTATPIPRSLSLTQYGDLDISVIKTLPATRKGQKTRIVLPENHEQYLSFLKTRLTMGEQAYIVVPAIVESPHIDMRNLTEVLETYKNYFPEFKVEGLHGQLKSSEKEEVLNKFLRKEIHVLVSTSVIEVGINIHNATVMSILSPERFGLSSLHQLRGRVGRGEKQGFCFLVADKSISSEALARLQVIEKNNDGFVIAEEDLKIRGEGDLFGNDQSGTIAKRKFANTLLHYPILKESREDLYKALSGQDPVIIEKMSTLSKDPRIFTTI